MRRNLAALFAAPVMALAAPALAQADPHAGHDMDGMTMPAEAIPEATQSARQAGQATPAGVHAGHGKKATGGAAGGHAWHGAAPASKPSPAVAQTKGDVTGAHAGHAMPATDSAASAAAVSGDAPHAMPARPNDGAAIEGPVMPAPHTEGDGADRHSGHAMPGMDMGGADPHAGHAMPAAPAAADASGTALEPGDAPAPAPPADRWADRYYGTPEMTRARAIARREHGGGTFGQIMFNLAEYQVRRGRDGYRWDGEGWFGGDIDRLTVKTEGEGDIGGGLGAAEVQALWSHALDAYWNVQTGVRIDAQPGPTRTYATIGVEGLAPYWFEVEGALFLSDKGDLLGRAEAYYDQRITQRLILQPRAELNFAAQDVPENRIGAGLVNAELGLRLRYEFAREFAPYVGVSWERRTGATARYARADGDSAGETSLVAGIRFWF